MKLVEVKRLLERRIGTSLEELDDYLHVYKFGPDTLMALVGYYLEDGHPDPASLEEIAGEVDKFLWSYAESGSVSPDTFTALFKVRTTALRLRAMLHGNVGDGSDGGFLCRHFQARVADRTTRYSEP